MIGIMSDSHDNRAAVRAAVAIFNAAECSLVLHAGDFVAPFTASELAHLACPVKAVFGNCDGERAGLARQLEPIGIISPEPLTFLWEGRSYILTHTQFANKKYLTKKPDVLVYGHTHKVDLSRQKNSLIINPGETGGWVTGVSTVVVLEPDTLTTEVITL